jgi:hypothetical protein
MRPLRHTCYRSRFDNIFNRIDANVTNKAKSLMARFCNEHIDVGPK